MKKYFIISTVFLLAMTSCTKDIDRYNEEKKAPATVPAETLFSNAVRNLTDGMVSANVNTNVFRFTVQHWAATTYQDEPNYDYVTRNIPQSWWARMYRDVLADLKDSKRIISEIEPGIITAATLNNQKAIVDIMEAFTYSILVNSFGNVPYTESNDPDNLFPTYDDAKAITDDLFVRLDADIAALSPEGDGFSSTSDFLYQGNIEGWSRFANTLKMRMAMIIADADVAKAQSAFEAASPLGLASSEDNAIFYYLETTPNTNPIWVDLIQSGRADMVAGKPLLDRLIELDDPRLDDFFDPNNAGDYVGGIVGTNNTFATTARPSEKMTAPDFPAVLLDFSEAEFLRAEAIERGWAVAGTAIEHYNNAITASILDWDGTAAEATAYLLQPEVNYLTAAGDWKQKISTQKWIALYNRPVEGWTELRRLDYPVLPPPTTPRTGFPNRFTYPGNEQNLNPANYTSGASAIGGDKVEKTKLFWDKF